MKGLILKDFLMMKSYVKTLAALFLIYAVMGFYNKNASFISFVIIFVSILMVMTTFSYDNYSKWDLFALSMPIRRKTMVTSKYLYALILCGGSTLISIAVSIGTSLITGQGEFEEILGVNYSVAAAAVLVIAILIPAIYKFGVEKGRFILIAVYLIPVLLAFILPQNLIPVPTEQQVMTALYVSPIFLLLIFVLSYWLSCRIYLKKEF